jgi:hypothetical protein
MSHRKRQGYHGLRNAAHQPLDTTALHEPTKASGAHARPTGYAFVMDQRPLLTKAARGAGAGARPCETVERGTWGAGKKLNLRGQSCDAGLSATHCEGTPAPARRPLTIQPARQPKQMDRYRECANEMMLDAQPCEVLARGIGAGSSRA